MLGHTLFRFLSSTGDHEVHGTVREPKNFSKLDLYTNAKLYSGIDILNANEFRALAQKIDPHVIINCVGIIKQMPDSVDPLMSIQVNSVWPRKLALIAADLNCRLVHFSTDCVFSGNKGNYSEKDMPDTTDLYGFSKLSGEVFWGNCLTLRTSIIGPELEKNLSLLEWFLSQSSIVKGYTKAIFSGLTTLEIAYVLDKNILKKSELSGLYHLSSEPIDKYTLLNKIKKEYGLSTTIEPDETVIINRSLDSGRLRRLLDYTPPSWDQMIGEMKKFD